MTLKHALLSSSFVMLNACGSADFAGSINPAPPAVSNKTNPPTANVQVATPTPAASSAPLVQISPSPSPVPTLAPTPVPCSAGSNKTFVQLLTAQIQNGAPNQIIQYQLSVLDCNGNLLPLTADKVLFDLEGVVDPADERPLDYTITNTAGVIIDQGQLQVVQGSDLFGNQGPHYFYDITDQPINVSAPTTRIIFNVSVSNIPYHRQSSTRYPKEEIINSYLKFGDAAVVLQPVKFVN